MVAPAPAPSFDPPGRALLRLAGVLSQLTCGACLLIGTIGLVLVQQTKAASAAVVVVWLAAAMAGLVFGGLIYRGGMVSLVIAAVIDAGFGVALVTLDDATLRALLKILPASDVATISGALGVAGVVMIGAGVTCLIALPEGIRFARWFRDAAEAAASAGPARSTSRGFPPPAVPARTAVYVIPADELPSRRWLYGVLGCLAIGVGVVVGVVVSSIQSAASDANAAEARAVGSATGSAGAAKGAAGAAKGSASVAKGSASVAIAATSAAGSAGSATGLAGSASGSASTASGSASVTTVAAGVAIVATTNAGAADTASAPGRDSVTSLLAAQHAAISRADARALAATMISGAFGFGIDADEASEGAAPVAEQIVRDLGELATGAYAVTSRSPLIGEDRGHAWIAEELEIAAGGETRRFAVSELAAKLGGSWQVVAIHWAVPVADATAERLAILKTLPTPHPLADLRDPRASADELDRAVRAAFASRAAFADAYSERPDAFNYGSGGERARGPAIKKVFGKLKAQIRLHDGARVVAGGQWDPAQRTAPWIGWAAINVDFTAKTRAATDVTQTFRVLAILVKDGADWKIVQTQWSNGGPIR